MEAALSGLSLCHVDNPGVAMHTAHMRLLILLSCAVICTGCNGSSKNGTGKGTSTNTGTTANKPTPKPTSTGTATHTPTPTTPPKSCATPKKPTGKVVYVTVKGNDKTGDGSKGKPWATISHAIEYIKDETTVIVGPGTYNGQARLGRQFKVGVTVRAVPMYQARLRNNGIVVRIYNGKGITLEGFDVAHSGPGAGPIVVHIQDHRGPAGGEDAVSRIVLRNNILHDSYNNDILKINNGAKEITVERNIFYNQHGSDEHIDINSVSRVVVRDNIFLNDFAASGRKNKGNTSAYIVIKDSNDDDDSYMGAERISVRRNVFMNWQGGPGANFVLVGEDGRKYYEAYNISIENNLMLGNSKARMRAPFGVKGARDITFRHNTIVGDLPGHAFAFRFNKEGRNKPGKNIHMYNNIWSDPTGTMTDFSDTPKGESEAVTLDNNLYWNNGKALPSESQDQVNVSDDKKRIEKDPKLPAIGSLTPPTWDAAKLRFRDGSGDTCAAFSKLVTSYATLGAGSAAIDSARTNQSPADDIRGKPRTGATSVGAYEPQ